MSRENVEVVLAAYAAWGAGEWEAQRASLDPDVFMRMAEGWPEPGPFLGRDAVERQLRQMRDTVEDGSAERPC